MSQNYQNFPKFCDFSVKIAPDLKEKLVFVAKKIKSWASFGVKMSAIFSEKMGALGDSIQFCEKYGVLWVRF